ncbi:CD81 antigen-like protein, partial [Leptotrombidium deliense]
LLGVGILGLSIYLYVDSNYYVANVDTADVYNTPIFVLMALGAIMTLVGFLGCCGAIRESTCLLGMYIFLCVSMGIACGAAVWWAVKHENDVQKEVEKNLKTIIKDRYTKGGKGATELFVDKVQQDFQCCGVDGAHDWSSSKYQQNNKSKLVNVGVTGTDGAGRIEVPASCCVHKGEECEKNRKEVFGTESKAIVKGVNIEGCSKSVRKYVEEKWRIIMTIAIIATAVQLFALLFAFCLCCTLCCYDDRDK